LGVVLLAALATPAEAQDGASEVRGRIVDQHGGVLTAVTVLLTSDDTGASRSVVNRADGTYAISQLPPGRYSLIATREGFRQLVSHGLPLKAGASLTVDLVLEIGSIDEHVIVTAEPPLIDRASAQIGGNIGGAELRVLPAMNRSLFALMPLVPGVQFVATTQMGNDTIVAGGQASQSNSITVDGGYNADDGTGGNFGAQVRLPIEAIEDVEVATGTYRAEHGRAGGAIVKVVTRRGTNRFSGVAFAFATSHRLTAEDYFVKTNDVPKPEASRYERGFVFGGPVIRNKAHFFFSFERQVDQPGRTRVYPTRPDLNVSVIEDRTTRNTLSRFDHQINGNHAWTIRWLREDAPQHPVVAVRATRDTFGDESDRDQMIVVSLGSVFGSSRVNTFRVGRTWEHFWQGNACFRAQGSNDEWTGFDFGDETAGNQALCPPQLDHLSFLAQAGTQVQGSWDSNYQIEDHFAWFVEGPRGGHELKVGARFNYAELRQVSQMNRNGTFRFNTDLPFDVSNPRTYPERLTIRVPAASDVTILSRTFDLYVQDTWQIGGTTMTAGVRYDLELIPIAVTENALFPPGQRYPIDANNIAPRLGFTHQLGTTGRALLRGAYGTFYNRTLLSTLADVISSAKYTMSAVVAFPNDGPDPGPRRGQFPTDPFLVNGPFINYDLLTQRFPPATRLRNTGTVVFDSPDRKQPFAHHLSVGYVHQLGLSTTFQVDYVRLMNEQMFLARNLNPMLRTDSTATGSITRTDAFGVLGESYNQRVWMLENGGESVYDGLHVQLDKRYAGGWWARVAYALSYARGTAFDQDARNTDQFLTDLRLDRRWGPSPVDRRHIFSASGRLYVPGSGGAAVAATVRYMSGAPFTLFDSSIDADRNGELDDPLPAGSYSGMTPNALTNVTYAGGRNGTYGPDYLQLDLRVGWHRALPKSALDLFVDVFNVTNRTNFDNPSQNNRDRRLSGTFLVLNQLSGGGVPRQAQVGIRYAF
jgi:hypothetical protein